MWCARVCSLLSGFGCLIENELPLRDPASQDKSVLASLCVSVHLCVHYPKGVAVTTIKVGVREFRERIASFLESDAPVAVTRRGETLGVYVPTRRKRPEVANLADLKAAADRLAEALQGVDEEELVADFKQLRRQGKHPAR